MAGRAEIGVDCRERCRVGERAAAEARLDDRTLGAHDRFGVDPRTASLEQTLEERAERSLATDRAARSPQLGEPICGE